MLEASYITGIAAMNLYAKLIVSLALTAGIAAGLLAFTYKTTEPVIAKREIEDKAKALESVFFLQSNLKTTEIADGVFAVYTADNDKEPAYYAATGEAIGYNSGVPVSLMVGFTGSSQDAAALLKGYVSDDKLPTAGEKGTYIVGFSVVNSEETPGLGEKIKDARPPFTWAQALTGTRPAPNPDKSTDFQRQFRGRLIDSLLLKKNGGDLDAITAATITSNGVVAALKNAGGKVGEALAETR